MSRRLSFALVPVIALAFAATCSGSSARDPRYPRRPPGCALSMYRGLPEVPVWDDVGVARVDCYLDESEIACLGRLRTEACRMGGDILYDVPSKAERPVERGNVQRAMVVHTRGATNVNKKDKDEGPPGDAGGGPIVPLPAAADVAAAKGPPDGGRPEEKTL